jgi:alpha-L-fucosidase
LDVKSGALWISFLPHMTTFPCFVWFTAFAVVSIFIPAPVCAQTSGIPSAKTTAGDAVKQEHAGINLGAQKTSADIRTKHPEAQWYPDAGLGLFIHWGICTVKGLNISWSMMNSLNGRPAQITPNEYFALARDFNPQNYHPDRWLKAAKDAGFVYAVLTTRHHEGFALWPSKYGDFDTDNYMGGKDLVRDFVDACRRHGLKVGFYYSPPHWQFDRKYRNFEFNKTKPPLDADLKPRPLISPDEEELKKHHAAYAEMIRGQMHELLTNYGKVDVLWFDGRPPMVRSDEIITLEQLRALQPSVVINPRLHGKGDFITYERALKTESVATEWAEYCNTWTPYWGDVTGAKFRAPAFIIGQYALCRSLHINYLPSIGPTADGELVPEAYEALATFGDWMAKNARSVQGTHPLPQGETASVPATSRERERYLFAIPKFTDPNNPTTAEQLPPADETLTLTGSISPRSVVLLAGGQPLEYTYEDGKLTVILPASLRTPLVDVVRIELPVQ